MRVQFLPRASGTAAAVLAILLSASVPSAPSTWAGTPTNPADLASYEAARAGVGRDPEANVRLALWCEARGLRAERLKHLALAVLSDPKNASARGLMGLVAYRGQWKRPADVAEKVKADEDLTARLAEYNARRARVANTADAHWALALWCESQGLEAEARAHFTVVTRRDPGREAAWKRLGCKKVRGRWVTEADLADAKANADAQRKADAHWKPLLTKWRGWLAEKSRRAAAEQALADVSDPRAVPAVWSVFVAGGQSSHHRAVQLLGRIDAPGSSRALAMLAVASDSAEARRAATETLRRRDPREFAGLLVGLLRKPIKYEVRPVGGPGTPGALFVEGKQYNVQRVYAPPAFPTLPASPNDRLEYDANGLPVITRSNLTRTISPAGLLWRSSLTLGQFAQFRPSDPALAAAASGFRANSANEWAHFFGHSPHNRALLISNPGAERNNLRVEFAQDGYRTTTTSQQTQIPVGQMMLEYQKTAIVAQQQLAQDIASVEAVNQDVMRWNERAAQVLGDVSGRDLGQDPESWRAWWVNVQGYAYTSAPETPRPTVVEDVPLDYTPQPVPVISSMQQATQVTAGPITAQATSTMPSCFGAGTLVRTLDGSRPIESIHVGDRVLTQDVTTGALGYQPVTVVHHNPPSPTFLIEVGGDTIVSSPFHRFWVAGGGWKMARDLGAGDVVRLLEGPAPIDSVASGPVQLVYNLDVADAHDFFAGAAAALVHDNTLPETRLAPFDASAPIANAASPR